MKTSKYIILLLILLSQCSIAQTWMWSKQAGGTNSDFVEGMCLDQSSNVYIAGNYSSQQFICETDTLNLTGFNDCFIVKYDASGNLQWAKGFGGSNPMNATEGINAIKYDPSSNAIIIAGFFYGTIILGADTLISNGSTDVVVAKFDLDGNCLWAKKAGSTGRDGATAMGVGQNGEIIVSCLMQSSSTFDTISVQQGSILAKYDASGNCLWAKKKFNTNGTIDGYDGVFEALKVKDGDIFGIGYSNVSSFMIDTITVNTNFIYGQYALARFDSNGVVKWIRPCAGEAQNGGWDIAVDDSSNSYITGTFSDSAIFENDTIVTSNNYELFLAKYNSSGHPVWVRQTNCSNTAIGVGIALNNNTDVYLLADFTGTATFGNISFTSTGLDMAIARYDSGGACIGAIQVAGVGGKSIATDISGSIYVTGIFVNTVTFGSNPSMTSLGTNNVFTAKLSAITGTISSSRLAGNQLVIYANPTAGICNVSIPDEFMYEHHLTLSIFDNSGKLIRQLPVEINAEKVRINLTEQAKGVYNVSLCNGSNRCYSGKIVFE